MSTPTRRGSSQAGGPLKYHLHLVASSVGELVHRAGGLAIDHSYGGWRVSVAMLESSDDTALRILGATRVDREDMISTLACRDAGHKVVAEPKIYHADRQLRAAITRAVARGAELWLWSAGEPNADPRGTAPISHDLSCGAQVFKVRARAVAGCASADYSLREDFWTSSSFVMPAPARDASRSAVTPISVLRS